VAIRALAPQTASLEELFFRLTEGDGRADPVGIGQVGFAGNSAPDVLKPAAVAFDDKLDGAEILPVLELEFACRREFQKHGFSFAAAGQARSSRPAWPSSVPKARKRPSALQAKAVLG